MEQYRGTMLMPNIWWTSADRILGLLAHTMGNLEQAAEHFEEALVFCRNASYRPELAWTCCDYAGLLLDPESKADRSKALTLLDESYSIATDLGMRPLMERVNLRIEQVQAQSVTATEFPGGLTHREVEVLRLIAGGKTNSEISEELVIAEGTARRHVANIYEKIGAANRAEATRYALREGLLTLDEDQSSSP